MPESLRRTPPVTRLLLVLIVLVYGGQALSEVVLGGDLLLYLGSRSNPEIAAGQWWRLITPVFLHLGVLHLAMNGLALYRLGPELEEAYGSERYLWLFVISGLAGSLAGYAFSPGISVGASGAIFGLLGAAAVFFFRHRALFGPSGQAMQQSLVNVLVINLIISILPGIDGWGHLGGLVAGILVAFAFGPRLVLTPRSPWDAPSGEVFGSSPYALVDVRPDGTRSRLMAASAVVLILALTGVLTAAGLWKRPALRTGQVSAPVEAPVASAQSSGRMRLGIAHVDVMDFHLERLASEPPAPREVFTAAEIAARYVRAKELGVGWHRWSMNWDLVIRGGNYDFKVTDGIVERDIAAGLRTLAVLHGVPPGERYYQGAPPSLAYPIFKRADGGLTDDPAEAASVNAQNLWADYVAKVVGRYKPGGELARARGWGAGVGVRAWEMGNEPNFKSFWPGTAAEFVRFMEVSYLVAKWVDPSSTVAHGGIADNGNSTWWFSQFADALKARAAASPLPARYNYYFDKSAWHWYQPAATLITPPARARAILRDRGLPVKPLWVTETGLSIWSEYPGPCWSGPSPGRGTLDEQANFISGTLGELGRSGIELMVFFQLFDDCGNGPTSYDAFGLVRNPLGQECFVNPSHGCWSPDPAKAGQPRPAFYVLQSAAGGAWRGGPLLPDAGDDLGDRAGDPRRSGGSPRTYDTSPPSEILVAAPSIAEAHFTVQIMAGDSSGLGAYQLYWASGPPPTSPDRWHASAPPKPWPGEPISGLVAEPFQAEPGDTVYFAAQVADRLGNWSALPPYPMAVTRTAQMVVRSNDAWAGLEPAETSAPAAAETVGGLSAGMRVARPAIGRVTRHSGWLPRGWLRDRAGD